MMFCSMTVSLIALYLGSLAANSFAQLTVIREQPLSWNGDYTFTCISEDDRSALVWNDDVNFPSTQHESTPNDFSPAPPSRDFDCSITEKGTCIAKWENTDKWRSMHSVDRPMGPVFDSRWENFEPGFFPPKSDNQRTYKLVREVPRSGAVVFSARGLGDIDLRLCEADSHSGCPCFTITIAASTNRTSKIYSSHEKDDQGYRTSDRLIIDASEWRTFTLEWNETSRKVGVYNGADFAYGKRFKTWINVSHLYIRSNDTGFARFHFYEYLMTDINNTELMSDKIYYSDNNYCVELLVGLCTECQLTVFNVYRTNAASRIEAISGSQARHGKLPTWQFVRIRFPLPNEEEKDGRYFHLKLVTRLNQNADEGLWAIDSFRRCESSSESKDNRRSSIIRVPGSIILASPLFPKIGCQRLRYDSHAVDNSEVPATDNVVNELSKCNREKLSPCCTLERDALCWGKSICQPSGCFCATGYGSDDCRRYNQNTQEIRYLCQTATPNLAGFCDGRCVGHYLPPSCRTGNFQSFSPCTIKFNWVSTNTKLKPPTVAYRTEMETGVVYTGLENLEIKSVLFQLKSPSESRWETVSSLNITMLTYTYTLRIFNISVLTTYTVRATVTTTRGWTAEFPDVTLPTECSNAVWQLTDLSATSERDGLVKLRWQSPDKYVTAYEVEIKSLKTTLKNKPPWNERFLNLAQNRSPFELEVHLSTATQYNFFIKARDACVHSGIIHRVPTSVDLYMEGKLIVNRSQTLITLKLPSIVNETVNTVLYVVVKGSPLCRSSPVPDDLRELLNMTESDEGWLAKKFEASETRYEYLTIGKGTGDVNSNTCSLDRHETYVIAVVAWDSVDGVPAVITSSPSRPIETTERTDGTSNQQNLNWVLILFILIISCCVIFLWRREILSALKRTRQTDFTSYSQTLTNWVKSTTTFPLHQPVPEDVDVDMFDDSSPPQAAPWNDTSHSIDVCDFEDYVKESVSNGLLKSQFKTLPKGLNKSHKQGSVLENKPKNRYLDIIPYDDTRVILKKLANDRYSDYINANYVHGFKKKKTYIAAQGPKPQTIIDFWRMIWQTETLVICMLANLVEGSKDRERVKCEQYWPEPGDTKTYGDVVVVNENNRVFSDFTFRTFRVACNEETRTIEQLHYTSWPDHGVPPYPNAVITYLKKLHSLPTGNRPIIVHCSAGIGRTGTIILCDIGYHRAMEKGTIDMLSEFRKLRNRRLNMVDNELQYIFAHVVLVEWLAPIPTELPCNDTLPQMMKELKKDLPHHIERLQQTAWEDEALHRLVPSRPAFPEQLVKNRFPELAPESSNLVYLERYPTRNVHSDYISAVMVNGLDKTKKQYIASQLPLPSTLSDFWRLVAEKRVELVIVLQRPDPDDPTCCSIISDEESFDPVPFLTVELVKSSDSEKSPRIEELVLSDMSWAATRTQQVTILTCLEWGLGKNGKPPPPGILVNLWKESEKVRREKGPTLVLCHDGVTGCGLYLALSFLLERMTVEQSCDAIYSVRAIRQARPDFVQSQEQFEYLYDAAANYMACFETYSNFA